MGSERIPVKIPKKRRSPSPAPGDELSDGEIESPKQSSDESEYDDHGEDESAPRDHVLKKMDSKLESDDFEVSLSSLAKKKSNVTSNTSSTKNITKKKSDEKVPEKKKTENKENFK